MDNPTQGLVEEEAYNLAEIMLQGLKFHRKLLDDPHIWDKFLDQFENNEVQGKDQIISQIRSYYLEEGRL